VALEPGACLLGDLHRHRVEVVVVHGAGAAGRLQTIPKSLYEAAEVDGASTWQQFIEITLPMLLPAIFVALIFRTIAAIQTFDIPYAMTGGGPGDSTESLAMYIHKTTLDFLDFGYGSALAALMFVLSMAATSGYLRYTRRAAGRGP